MNFARILHRQSTVRRRRKSNSRVAATGRDVGDSGRGSRGITLARSSRPKNRTADIFKGWRSGAHDSFPVQLGFRRWQWKIEHSPPLGSVENVMREAGEMFDTKKLVPGNGTAILAWAGCMRRDTTRTEPRIRASLKNNPNKMPSEQH